MDVQAVGGLRLGTVTAVGGGGRSGQQFVVAQDQQLEGMVVSIDHDSVVIQIGGQRVAATTDASVRPGDVLQLVVREASADQVLMQIVGRGGLPPVQTRQLTRQELAAELTNVGVEPDAESIAIARELLARGEPLTADNVLQIRAAVARAVQARAGAQTVALVDDLARTDVAALVKGQTAEAETSTPTEPRSAAAPAEPRGAAPRSAARLPVGSLASAAEVDPGDVRAAVFLKSQRLPVTPTAIRIVRQAWASRSTLGEHVEQLRDVLADLSARLAGEAAPQASASPYLSPGGAGELGEAPAAQVGAAPARAGEAAPSPGARPEPAAPPPAATAEAVPPDPDGAAQGPGGGDPAAPTAAQPQAVGRAPALAAGVPDPRAAADVQSEAPAPSTPLPAGTVLAANPADPAPRMAQASAPRPGPAAPRSPSLASMLDVVAKTLNELRVVDDEAVRAPRAELARQIREIVAEHGTPVEAKIARVLEGLVARPGLDREALADLRVTLANLVDVAQRHLDEPRLAQQLSHEALRDVQLVHEHAGAILGQVELQQMANAHAATTPGPDNAYLMFQVPIPGGRGGQTAQIRIRQEEQGGTKRIDPKNVHVVFQFELRHLGTVRVSLRVHDQRISCRMGSSDPDATTLLGAHAGELRDGLGSLGYFVDDLRCSVLTPEEIEIPDGAFAVAPRAPTMRLDARA